MRLLPTFLLAILTVPGSAPAMNSVPDPVLEQEKAIAADVEAKTDIHGFDLRGLAPKIHIDGGLLFSRYDGPRTNIVHEEHWSKLPKEIHGTFDEWASYTSDEKTGEQLFSDMFYRFFFVHELGHWMQDQVLRQRHDEETKHARKQADNNRWQYELTANRISVAWWREHDPTYLAKLVNDMRTIQRKLPNPVPKGEGLEHFFTRKYDKLAEDPNAYGWFQLQMVILAYEEQPVMTFQSAINRLPAQNYDQ